MKKVILLFASALIVSSTALAQKIKHQEGSIDPIKSEKAMNIAFHYDDMKVGKKLTEAEYIERKTADYNKDEPGRGDTWAKSWVNDRESRYEPKFMELFNETGGEAGVSVAKDESLPYTLLVQTYYTEPGFNVGVARKDAAIHVMYTIVKTGTEEVVVKYNQENIPGRTGMGADFDTGQRISEAYAKGGKSLGKMMAKELK